MMYAGCIDVFNDIFHLLSPMELNNIEFLLDDTPLDAMEFLESYVKVPGENLEVTKVDSGVDPVRSSSRKRGRPKVVTMSGHLLRERRDAANARERKRMNQMTRYKETPSSIYVINIKMFSFNLGLTKL